MSLSRTSLSRRLFAAAGAAVLLLGVASCGGGEDKKASGAMTSELTFSILSAEGQASSGPLWQPLLEEGPADAPWVQAAEAELQGVVAKAIRQVADKGIEQEALTEWSFGDLPQQYQQQNLLDDNLLQALKSYHALCV